MNIRKTPRTFEILERRQMLAAGDLDTTFSGDGFNRLINAGNDASGAAVAVQSDGKTVIVGIDELDDGSTVIYVVRLTTAGSFDNTFDGNGIQAIDFGSTRSDRGTDVKILSNGDILVAGSSTVISNLVDDFALARLNSNGSLDTDFSGDGKVLVDFGREAIGRNIAVDANGKIVMVGVTDGIASGDNGDVAIARLNSNGTLDKTFSGDGKHIVDTSGTGKRDIVQDFSLAPNGKYIVGAATFQSVSRDWQVSWIHPSGNLYRTKRIAMGGDDYLTDLVVSSSGKITVVGTVVNGDRETPAVARLTSTGVYDPTLDGDGRLVMDDLFTDRGFANSVALYPDGKLVVGMYVENFGDLDFAVARLNSNGSFDTTFSGDGFKTYSFPPSPSGSSFPEDYLFSMVIAGGKLIAVGSSTIASGESRMAVMRVLL